MDNAGAISQVQFPPASTVAEQVCPAPSSTFTVAPISPVPVKVGVVSDVVELSAGDVTVGCAGAEVSTVTSKSAERAEVLAPSSAVAVKVWVPSVRAVAV